MRVHEYEIEPLPKVQDQRSRRGRITYFQALSIAINIVQLSSFKNVAAFTFVQQNEACYFRYSTVLM